MKRRCGLIGLAVALIALAVSAASASATESTTVEETYESPENGWDKVERIYDSDEGFSSTDWPDEDERMDQFGQRKTFFGNVARPASGRFLLYYGEDWSTNERETPVLLVPGAFSEPDGTWANPSASRLGCGLAEESCPSTGMMQALAGAGHRTFAVNFNNGAGDNYNWAEVIHDAIQRVKAVTGAEEVDVVAWSKGTVAARMYVSGMKRAWGSSYAGDVRKLVLMGGMGGGWDWIFRHGREPSYLVYPECSGGAFQPLGATAHTGLWCGGAVNDVHFELSVYKTATYGDPFVGIRQMLRKLTSSHSLGIVDLDYWSTYYGGWGYLYGSYSNGIDYALNQTPGSVIGGLRSTYTVPEAIDTYLLCGTANDIPPPWHNEASTSDGTIFTDSCDDETGIGNVPEGGNVHVARNHLELVWDEVPVSQVQSWLE